MVKGSLVTKKGICMLLITCVQNDALQLSLNRRIGVTITYFPLTLVLQQDTAYAFKGWEDKMFTMCTIKVYLVCCYVPFINICITLFSVLPNNPIYQSAKGRLISSAVSDQIRLPVPFGKTEPNETQKYNIFLFSQNV